LCFEVLFVRGGLDPEIGAAAVRHAHAATPTAETTPRLSV
jgi:hypothetical protein